MKLEFQAVETAVPNGENVKLSGRGF